jgi:hypothetical protein
MGSLLVQFGALGTQPSVIQQEFRLGLKLMTGTVITMLCAEDTRTKTDRLATPAFVKQARKTL